MIIFKGTAAPMDQVGKTVQVGAIKMTPEVAGEWTAFGDPVPLFSTGPRAGFHVHDLYHLTLLAETGWSAVLLHLSE